MPLNDNQKRRVLASFRYVDGLLSEAEDLISSGERNSPFAQHARDLSPAQREVLGDSIARLREQMAAALSALAVPLPEPGVSCRWAVRGMLLNIETALVELDPEYMRGYGTLEEEAGRVLMGVTADLRKSVARLADFLSESRGESSRTPHRRPSRGEDE